MKLYLINNKDEWSSTLIKLFDKGYCWMQKDYKDNNLTAAGLYPAAVSFDDWYDNKDNNFKKPLVIWCYENMKIRWCTLEYLKEKYHDEWFQLMRKEKLKKLNNIQ